MLIIYAQPIFWPLAPRFAQVHSLEGLTWRDMRVGQASKLSGVLCGTVLKTCAFFSLVKVLVSRKDWSRGMGSSPFRAVELLKTMRFEINLSSACVHLFQRRDSSPVILWDWWQNCVLHVCMSDMTCSSICVDSRRSGLKRCKEMYLLKPESLVYMVSCI